jgi:molecular chaperone DnaJ
MVKEEKKLSVKIPAGVDTGLRLRITGEGEGGQRGGPSGDLYVILFVEESEIYERDGIDIIYSQTISFPQAALGAKLNIETLDGPKDIEVPAGTQHGDRLTVPGLGVPHIRGIGRGDLFIEFKLQVPKKMTKEQIELVEKLAEISGDPTRHQKGGFFHRIFD